MWVSIASDAACAAALQQALDDYGVVDTDALQAVLEIPETAAAGLARALCTALQAAPPVMVDASTMASVVASSDAGVSAVVRTRDVGSTATFSPTGARLVAKEVQASPRVRTSEAQTLGATGTADTGASPDKVTMVDASTSHYLVPGIGRVGAWAAPSQAAGVDGCLRALPPTGRSTSLRGRSRSDHRSTIDRHHEPTPAATRRVEKLGNRSSNGTR